MHEMGVTLIRAIGLFVLVVAVALAVVGIFLNWRDEHAQKAERVKPAEPQPKRMGTPELVGRVVDVHGFEYLEYRVADEDGCWHRAWRRIIPTTYPFSCPDCGGMVVGVDTPRVRPGGKGPEPVAYRCENCGRQQATDFGVPRIEDRLADLTYEEPRGCQAACPKGGRHEWQLEEEWSEESMPEGVDPCLENLPLLEVVTYRRWRCAKCGETRTEKSP